MPEKLSLEYNQDENPYKRFSILINERPFNGKGKIPLNAFGDTTVQFLWPGGEYIEVTIGWEELLPNAERRFLQAGNMAAYLEGKTGWTLELSHIFKEGMGIYPFIEAEALPAGTSSKWFSEALSEIMLRCGFSQLPSRIDITKIIHKATNEALLRNFSGPELLKSGLIKLVNQVIQEKGGSVSDITYFGKAEVQVMNLRLDIVPRPLVPLKIKSSIKDFERVRWQIVSLLDGGRKRFPGTLSHKELSIKQIIDKLKSEVSVAIKTMDDFFTLGTNFPFWVWHDKYEWQKIFKSVRPDLMQTEIEQIVDVGLREILSLRKTMLSCPVGSFSRTPKDGYKQDLARLGKKIGEGPGTPRVGQLSDSDIESLKIGEEIRDKDWIPGDGEPAYLDSDGYYKDRYGKPVSEDKLLPGEKRLAAEKRVSISSNDEIKSIIPAENMVFKYKTISTHVTETGIIPRVSEKAIVPYISEKSTSIVPFSVINGSLKTSTVTGFSAAKQRVLDEIKVNWDDVQKFWRTFLPPEASKLTPSQLKGSSMTVKQFVADFFAHHMSYTEARTLQAAFKNSIDKIHSLLDEAKNTGIISKEVAQALDFTLNDPHSPLLKTIGSMGHELNNTANPLNESYAQMLEGDEVGRFKNTRLRDIGLTSWSDFKNAKANPALLLPTGKVAPLPTANSKIQADINIALTLEHNHLSGLAQQRLVEAELAQIVSPDDVAVKGGEFLNDETLKLNGSRQIPDDIKSSFEAPRVRREWPIGNELPDSGLIGHTSEAFWQSELLSKRGIGLLNHRIEEGFTHIVELSAKELKQIFIDSNGVNHLEISLNDIGRNNVQSLLNNLMPMEDYPHLEFRNGKVSVIYGNHRIAAAIETNRSIRVALPDGQAQKFAAQFNKKAYYSNPARPLGLPELAKPSPRELIKPIIKVEPITSHIEIDGSYVPHTSKLNPEEWELINKTENGVELFSRRKAPTSSALGPRAVKVVYSTTVPKIKPKVKIITGMRLWNVAGLADVAYELLIAKDRVADVKVFNPDLDIALMHPNDQTRFFKLQKSVLEEESANRKFDLYSNENFSHSIQTALRNPGDKALLLSELGEHKRTAQQELIKLNRAVTELFWKTSISKNQDEEFFEKHVYQPGDLSDKGVTRRELEATIHRISIAEKMINQISPLMIDRVLKYLKNELRLEKIRYNRRAAGLPYIGYNDKAYETKNESDVWSYHLLFGGSKLSLEEQVSLLEKVQQGVELSLEEMMKLIGSYWPFIRSWNKVQAEEDAKSAVSRHKWMTAIGIILGAAFGPIARWVTLLGFSGSMYDIHKENEALIAFLHGLQEGPNSFDEKKTTDVSLIRSSIAELYEMTELRIYRQNAIDRKVAIIQTYLAQDPKFKEWYEKYVANATEEDKWKYQQFIKYNKLDASGSYLKEQDVLKRLGEFVIYSLDDEKNKQIIRMFAIVNKLQYPNYKFEGMENADKSFAAISEWDRYIAAEGVDAGTTLQLLKARQVLKDLLNESSIYFMRLKDALDNAQYNDFIVKSMAKDSPMMKRKAAVDKEYMDKKNAEEVYGAFLENFGPRNIFERIQLGTQQIIRRSIYEIIITAIEQKDYIESHGAIQMNGEVGVYRRNAKEPLTITDGNPILVEEDLGSAIHRVIKEVVISPNYYGEVISNAEITKYQESIDLARDIITGREYSDKDKKEAEAFLLEISGFETKPAIKPITIIELNDEEKAKVGLTQLELEFIKKEGWTALELNEVRNKANKGDKASRDILYLGITERKQGEAKKDNRFGEITSSISIRREEDITPEEKMERLNEQIKENYDMIINNQKSVIAQDASSAKELEAWKKDKEEEEYNKFVKDHSGKGGFPENYDRLYVVGADGKEVKMYTGWEEKGPDGKPTGLPEKTKEYKAFIKERETIIAEYKKEVDTIAREARAAIYEKQTKAWEETKKLERYANLEYNLEKLRREEGIIKYEKAPNYSRDSSAPNDSDAAKKYVEDNVKSNIQASKDYYDAREDRLNAEDEVKASKVGTFEQQMAALEKLEDAKNREAKAAAFLRKFNDNVKNTPEWIRSENANQKLKDASGVYRQYSGQTDSDKKKGTTIGIKAEERKLSKRAGAWTEKDEKKYKKDEKEAREDYIKAERDKFLADRDLYKLLGGYEGEKQRIHQRNIDKWGVGGQGNKQKSNGHSYGCSCSKCKDLSDKAEDRRKKSEEEDKKRKEELNRRIRLLQNGLYDPVIIDGIIKNANDEITASTAEANGKLGIPPEQPPPPPIEPIPPAPISNDDVNRWRRKKVKKVQDFAKQIQEDEEPLF